VPRGGEVVSGARLEIRGGVLGHADEPSVDGEAQDVDHRQSGVEGASLRIRDVGVGGALGACTALVAHARFVRSGAALIVEREPRPVDALLEVVWRKGVGEHLALISAAYNLNRTLDRRW
jgi:hypothetical protein